MISSKTKTRALKRKARKIGRPLKVVAWEMIGDQSPVAGYEASLWRGIAKEWLISKGFSRKIFSFILGR